MKVCPRLRVLLAILSSLTRYALSLDEAKAPQCDVYMAAASFRENSPPVSFFAGKDIVNGTVIPVADMGIHLSDLDFDDFPNDIMTSMWSSQELVGAQYADDAGDDGLGFISGLGWAGTINPGITNTRWHLQGIADRYASLGGNGVGSLDYRLDAMASAISEYFNIHMVATKNIKMGMEIFPYFGEPWMNFQQDEADDDGYKSFKEEHDKATAIVEAYADVMDKHGEDLEIRDAQHYWDFIRNEVVSEVKILSLLPQNVTDVPIIADLGTIVHHNPQIKKSASFLASKGVCADNILQSKSTVSGAGRGAFAKRPIKTCDIVAPAPLLRLNSSLLVMNNGEDTSTVPEMQLLTNYVFGSPLNEDVVFYPYGSGVNYINHASHSSSNTANVKMAWSNKDYHRAEELEESLDDTTDPLAHVMDIVAIRDIQEGEEIFLDYGANFDVKLRNYFNKFEDPALKENLEPKAGTMNQMTKKNHDPVRTMDEQKTDPYPENVLLLCYMDSIEAAKINGNELTTSASMTIPPGFDFQRFSDIKKYRMAGYPSLVECDILSRSKNKGKNDEYLYMVRLYQGETAEEKPYIVDVPSSGLMFVDRPYQSAAQLEGSFRHIIEIPSEIFPKAWRKASTVCVNGSCEAEEDSE
jgi:hypothetical protein